MELVASRKRNGGPQVGARRDFQKERFGAYFPRLFAYALAATGDDSAAKDAVVHAFSETFAMPNMRGDEFEVELFRAVRDACRDPESGRRQPEDGLNGREREIISLMFDAQLDRVQIGRLLGIKPETVGATLVRGLRKLRSRLAASPAGMVAPSYT